jgi:hypothetical protein
MGLWISWFDAVPALRHACARKRTFLRMTLAPVGFSIRDDLLGVTSFVRACFLKGTKYRRLLQFFHSQALHLQKLTALWVRCALRKLRIRGRADLARSFFYGNGGIFAENEVRRMYLFHL